MTSVVVSRASPLLSTKCWILFLGNHASSGVNHHEMIAKMVTPPMMTGASAIVSTKLINFGERERAYNSRFVPSQETHTANTRPPQPNHSKKSKRFGTAYSISPDSISASETSWESKTLVQDRSIHKQQQKGHRRLK